jgi:hypothetical protein
MAGLLLGCSGLNKDLGDRTTSHGSMPSPAGVAEGSRGAGEKAQSPFALMDSHASGGSTLPAYSTYGGGATQQQNVNPGPFLTAAHAATQQQQRPEQGLVSRADGDMYGPTDQIPAGAGPGK